MFGFREEEVGEEVGEEEEEEEEEEEGEGERRKEGQKSIDAFRYVIHKPIISTFITNVVYKLTYYTNLKFQRMFLFTSLYFVPRVRFWSAFAVC